MQKPLLLHEAAHIGLPGCVPLLVFRWDDVAKALEDEVKFRVDSWRLLWQSFVSLQPFPFGEDELEQKTIYGVQYVLGGNELPSVNERNVYPTVMGCLTQTSLRFALATVC